MPQPLNLSPNGTTVNYLDKFQISPYAAKTAEEIFEHCDITDVEQKREMFGFITSNCPSLAESPEILLYIINLASIERLTKTDGFLASKVKIIKTALREHQEKINEAINILTEINNQQFCTTQTTNESILRLESSVSAITELTKTLSSTIEKIPTLATDTISEMVSMLVAAASTPKRESSTRKERFTSFTIGFLLGLCVMSLTVLLIPSTPCNNHESQYFNQSSRKYHYSRLYLSTR